MKKHIIICYLIACIGILVGIFVILYSAFISEFKLKYPFLWGSALVSLLAMIRLSHLKKTKHKWPYYYVTALISIIFIMSLFDLYS